MHYHLLGGMSGLHIPNFNQQYNTKAEVMQALKDEVGRELDDMVANGLTEAEAESNVTWNRDLDYVTIRHGGNECYHVESCYYACVDQTPTKTMVLP